MSVATYERELRRVEREQRFEEAHALDLHFQANFLYVHRQQFEPAQRTILWPQPADLDGIRKRLESEALGSISVFNRGSRRQAKSLAAAQAESAAATWEAQQARAVAEQQREIDVAWDKVMANDPHTVLATIEDAFEDNEVPAAAIDCRADLVAILLRFPALDAVVPESHSDLTPAGRPTVKKRSKTDRNAMYACALLSHALVTAKEAFVVAPAVREITLLAVAGDETEGPAPVLSPLYCTSFDRASFDHTDWEQSAPTIAGEFGGMINFRGRTSEVWPLDLRDEPQVLGVVEHIAEDLGWAVDPRCWGDARDASARPSEEDADVDRGDGSEKASGVEIGAEVRLPSKLGPPFYAWQAQRDRFATDVATENDAPARYTKLMLAGAVLKSQFEYVNQLLDEGMAFVKAGQGLMGDGLVTGDVVEPELREWDAFRGWVGPWLTEIQAESDRYDEGREALRSQLSSEDVARASAQFDEQFAAIEASVIPPSGAAPAPGIEAPTTSSPLPPAAWYENPENPAQWRYWDGASWTDHVSR